LLTAFPFASRTAQAQDEGIRIVLLPESVALEPGEPVPVQLIVENPGPGEVQNVTLTWFPSQGLQVTARPAALTTLPAGAARVFRVEVEQSGSGMLPGRITFRVRYQEIDEAGARTTRFASAQLDVEAAPVESADRVARLDVRTTLVSLSENRPGRLYLLVTNTSNVEIQVTQVTARRPRFIHLRQRQDLPLAIRAGKTRAVRFDVTAGNKLQPGKQLLLFGMEVAWARGGDRLTGNLVATHEVSVEVFGESAILGVIAVPALLLLPGALIVLTAAFGLKWLWKRETVPADVKSAPFWLLAVPLSFLMAAAYPVLPWGQNYLLAYGFKDLVLIWVTSSGLGALVFLVWLTSGASWRRLTLPRETDSARAVLRKLGRRWSRVYRARVIVETDGQAPGATAGQAQAAGGPPSQEIYGFLLQRKVSSGVGQWVGPRILIHFAPESGLREEVESHLTRTGRIGDVLRLLKRAGEQVEVRFDPASSLKGPRLAAKVALAGRDDLLIVPRTGLPG
jgi:hypothetical protein